MFCLIQAPNGWFYSEKFNYWQKTEGRVVAYVTELICGYQVQLYHRGQIGFCELEARTNDNTKEGYKKMFMLGEMWLLTYSDGDFEKINNDKFHISNPNGVWIKNREEKNYWI
jgi:chitinase